MTDAVPTDADVPPCPHCHRQRYARFVPVPFETYLLEFSSSSGFQTVRVSNDAELAQRTELRTAFFRSVSCATRRTFAGVNQFAAANVVFDPSVASDSLGIDYGVVAIYVCPSSCVENAMVEEIAFVQESP